MSGRHQPENGADSETPLQSPEEAHHSAGVAPDGVASQTVPDSSIPATTIPRSGTTDKVRVPSRDRVRDALRTLPKPGAIDEAIVTEIASAYADGFLEVAAERASYASGLHPESGGLDVERLAKAIRFFRHRWSYSSNYRQDAEELAAEYARLATPQRASGGLDVERVFEVLGRIIPPNEPAPYWLTRERFLARLATPQPTLGEATAFYEGQMAEWERIKDRPTVAEVEAMLADGLRLADDWLNTHPGVRMTAHDHADWWAFLRSHGYDPATLQRSETADLEPGQQS